MERHFTLEYWVDDGWYVGKLKEVPGVFSQGETLEELEENIKDAYRETLDEELTSVRVSRLYTLQREFCSRFAVVATVSAFCWPWAFRYQRPTTTANCAVIVATTTGISRAKPFG
jgi:predicted RNase H-like HicB family nuclease